MFCFLENVKNLVFSEAALTMIEAVELVAEFLQLYLYADTAFSLRGKKRSKNSSETCLNVQCSNVQTFQHFKIPLESLVSYTGSPAFLTNVGQK